MNKQHEELIKKLKSRAPVQVKQPLQTQTPPLTTKKLTVNECVSSVHDRLDAFAEATELLLLMGINIDSKLETILNSGVEEVDDELDDQSNVPSKKQDKYNCKDHGDTQPEVSSAEEEEEEDDEEEEEVIKQPNKKLKK